MAAEAKAVEAQGCEPCISEFESRQPPGEKETGCQAGVVSKAGMRQRLSNGAGTAKAAATPRLAAAARLATAWDSRGP